MKKIALFTSNRSEFSACYALIKHKGLVETYKTLGYTEADSYTS